MKQDNNEPGSFLERWSRRKRGLEDEAVATDPEAAGSDEDFEAAANGQAVADGSDGSEPVVEKDFSDFDFDKLDFDSDYEQFMDKNVSHEARNKALRKLWVSNPVLANMDGLDDYCEDYTDAAVCMPKGTMKTLYQFGRGFLDDDEVAAWEALGHEPKEDAVIADAGDAETVETAQLDDAAEVGSSELPEADTGPGAGCAAAVKQDEAEMLAEYEADATGSEADPPSPSKA
ncbi:MAG: DUF3306 domain-containing protein [Alphaproteobacteria bacterium]|nr:DUF3306 domain-containing protein [Alphaproteobacteria bacterium]